MMKLVAWFIFYLLFLISLVLIWKFQLGKEGKDERGQSIVNKANSISFALIPIGAFLIDVFDKHIQPLGYGTFKMCIWSLIMGAFIVNAGIIQLLKRI